VVPARIGGPNPDRVVPRSKGVQQERGLAHKRISRGMETGRTATGEVSLRRMVVIAADDDEPASHMAERNSGYNLDDVSEETDEEAGENVDSGEEGDDAGEYYSGDEGEAAELSWYNLKVTSPDGKKVLLSDACGRAKGRFLAIMGPSGAGKVDNATPPPFHHPRARIERRKKTPAYRALLVVVLIAPKFSFICTRTDQPDEHAGLPVGQGQGVW
jgi:hypothetical protein